MHTGTGGGQSGGAQTGGGQTGGSGPPVECKVDGDCPELLEFCKEPKCDDGKCTTKSTSEGTVLPESEQTAGDCQKLVCNGKGAAIEANDNGDPSSDNKQCTSDSCKNGVPKYESLPSGTSCNEQNGKVCDGKGECVACVVNADCGQVLYDCKSYICNQNNACELVSFPPGTPASSQKLGDCLVTLCDGFGNTYQQADNGDVPFDKDPLDCLVPYCGVGGASEKKVDNNTACCNGQQVCCGGICCQVGFKCDSNSNVCSY